jgi:hypothetical protein
MVCNADALPQPAASNRVVRKFLYRRRPKDSKSTGLAMMALGNCAQCRVGSEAHVFRRTNMDGDGIVAKPSYGQRPAVTKRLWTVRLLSSWLRLDAQAVAMNDTDDREDRSIAKVDRSFFWEALLEEQEKRQVRMVAELKDAIRAGIMSGPGVLADKVFDRLEEKYAAMGVSSHD